ncbi:LysM peptidoglycan-binding domain-containing protein [Flavobacteriaceae bacterium XHP0103]|uniref:PBP1 and LysM peptidoglycan-binding domain-containing protein n=1 Tax=Marixanthotalea marina TaxID=2844359 RepID=UPI002989AFED|nr:LysM peptidoglycan-binding domain-containing protein [Marixanthotalea marina]MBU3821281.1 LysM peptidoglycan-binding domain-containing protein [Marixanthotalea marina]
MIKFFSVLSFILLFSFTINAQNYSTHSVKEGETIEGIAKRYYVSPSDIYALNPETKKGLKPNIVLIIPISKANKPIVTVTKELQGFKTHRTSRKETLYGIAKEYGVTEDDIKKYNTFLYANVLQKGDKLQIPVFKVTEVVEENPSTKTYTVKPKEGKWRIAYKFGISISDLEALNPNMGEVLQAGQQINVPNINDTDVKVIDEKYSYYEVKPREGFYRLKVEHGLEQEELEALNPGLAETGLKAGMWLKVPFSSEFQLGSESPSINLVNKITDYETKHIAVMLPFRLNRVTIDSIEDTKNRLNKDAYLKSSIDFYTGVLTAIDSLKKLGISLKVDVYDTKNEVSEVSNILRTHNFENVDAVIGPLTPSCFDRVVADLSSYKIPVISPNSSKLNLQEHVFQSIPPDDLFKTKVVNYFKADTVPNNIVIVSDSENAATSRALQQEFSFSKIIFSRKNKDGKDENYIMREDIRNVLKPGKNIVFLETKDEGYVSNVTSLLSALNGKRRNEKSEAEKPMQIILTTTMMSKAFESDQIKNEHLSSLNFVFASESKSYNDANNPFVKNYEKTYALTPSKVAVRGFDLTMDTVLRLVTSEDLYLSANEAPLTEYVENKFAYKKKLIGGYYNDSVYLLKYQDLNIVEVK